MENCQGQVRRYEIKEEEGKKQDYRFLIDVRGREMKDGKREMRAERR